MAVVEIEVKEDGSFGTLPEPVQKFLDAKYNEAFGKGAEKAAKDAQKQIEEAVRKARDEAKRDGADPAAIEKAKNLESELSKLREEEAKREKNFEEAQRLRDERYAKDLAEREAAAAERDAAAQAAIEKREARIRSSVTTDIKAETVKAGAREGSVDEVSELLAKYVDLDEDFAPVVKAELFRQKFAESKLGEDGKAVSIEGLVAEYLALKPHHKAAPAGRGGNARNGHSLSGTPPSKTSELDARLEDVKTNPTMANVENYIEKMLETAR